MSAIMHVRGLEYKESRWCFKGLKKSDNCRGTLDGLRFDTCANRTSDIGSNQYQAYCRTFNLSFGIKPSESRMIKRFCGRVSSTGNAFIQIPFQYLDVVFDVLFMVIEEDTPALLSMKGMLDNGLDIFIQVRYASLGERRQPLQRESYFLIQRW